MRRRSVSALVGHRLQSSILIPVQTWCGACVQSGRSARDEVLASAAQGRLARGRWFFTAAIALLRARWGTLDRPLNWSGRGQPEVVNQTGRLPAFSTPAPGRHKLRRRAGGDIAARPSRPRPEQTAAPGKSSRGVLLAQGTTAAASGDRRLRGGRRAIELHSRAARMIPAAFGGR